MLAVLLVWQVTASV